MWKLYARNTYVVEYVKLRSQLISTKKASQKIGLYKLGK